MIRKPDIWTVKKVLLCEDKLTELENDPDIMMWDNYGSVLEWLSKHVLESDCEKTARLLRHTARKELENPNYLESLRKLDPNAEKISMGNLSLEQFKEFFREPENREYNPMCRDKSLKLTTQNSWGRQLCHVRAYASYGGNLSRKYCMCLWWKFEKHACKCN